MYSDSSSPTWRWTAHRVYSGSKDPHGTEDEFHLSANLPLGYCPCQNLSRLLPTTYRRQQILPTIDTKHHG